MVMDGENEAPNAADAPEDALDSHTGTERRRSRASGRKSIPPPEGTDVESIMSALDSMIDDIKNLSRSTSADSVRSDKGGPSAVDEPQSRRSPATSARSRRSSRQSDRQTTDRVVAASSSFNWQNETEPHAISAAATPPEHQINPPTSRGRSSSTPTPKDQPPTGFPRAVLTSNPALHRSLSQLRDMAETALRSSPPPPRSNEMDGAQAELSAGTRRISRPQSPVPALEVEEVMRQLRDGIATDTEVKEGTGTVPASRPVSSGRRRFGGSTGGSEEEESRFQEIETVEQRVSRGRSRPSTHRSARTVEQTVSDGGGVAVTQSTLYAVTQSVFTAAEVEERASRPGTSKSSRSVSGGAGGYGVESGKDVGSSRPATSSSRNLVVSAPQNDVGTVSASQPSSSGAGGLETARAASSSRPGTSHATRNIKDTAEMITESLDATPTATPTRPDSMSSSRRRLSKPDSRDPDDHAIPVAIKPSRPSSSHVAGLTTLRPPSSRSGRVDTGEVPRPGTSQTTKSVEATVDIGAPVVMASHDIPPSPAESTSSSSRRRLSKPNSRGSVALPATTTSRPPSSQADRTLDTAQPHTSTPSRPTTTHSPGQTAVVPDDGVGTTSRPRTSNLTETETEQHELDSEPVTRLSQAIDESLHRIVKEISASRLDEGEVSEEGTDADAGADADADVDAHTDADMQRSRNDEER
ncbi:hypothetical protein HK104_006317, partial [Borealophlyctis nickersoniae]